MNLVASHNVAGNGTEVQSSVRLYIEEVGVQRLPFRVQVYVGHSLMFTGHYATEAEAKDDREKMHAAYLEVHSLKVSA